MNSFQAADVVRVREGESMAVSDWLAVERPLEIRARVGTTTRVVSTTMRTPGEDPALVAGFLFAEGVIAHARDVRLLESVADDVVLIELDAAAAGALEAARRPFVTTGACGVCGRGSVDSLAAGEASTDDGWTVDASVVHRLPAALRDAQSTFERTGGLHAAGLFAPDGTLRAVHEDVGRHNAVDKLVGTLLLAGRLPARDGILVVSGRASFELAQKASAAGLPVMVAVGAPSSLAVEIARAADMTLLGFARDRRFNVYTGARRVSGI